MYEPMFILKIRLVDSKPEIWRRFAVPGRITLDRLHDVIQIVMGWTDSHLHEFTIGSKHYTEFPQKGDGMLASEKYHLEALAKKRGRTFEYLYDLGDSWKHEITIEHNDIGIRPTNSLMNNPRSVAIVCASTDSMRHRHDKRLIPRAFIRHTHQWPTTQAVLQGAWCPLFDVPVLAT